MRVRLLLGSLIASEARSLSGGLVSRIAPFAPRPQGYVGLLDLPVASDALSLSGALVSTSAPFAPTSPSMAVEKTTELSEHRNHG